MSPAAVGLLSVVRLVACPTGALTFVPIALLLAVMSALTFVSIARYLVITSPSVVARPIVVVLGTGIA